MENSIASLTGELKRMGLPNHLCDPWQQMLDDARDKETLVRMYLRGIDFCLAYDYPGIDYMKRHFKGMCEPFGVFVDEPVQVCNADKVVAVGGCVGTVDYDGYEVGQVFVKHDSRLAVIAAGNALVTVDCFDRSTVDVLAKGSALVTVYRYGDAVVNVCGGNVKVIDKHSKTYE